MKKKVLTFSLILVSCLVFGCAEEVVPNEPIIDEGTNTIMIDDQKSTDGEEEEGNGYDPNVG